MGQDPTFSRPIPVDLAAGDKRQQADGRVLFLFGPKTSTELKKYDYADKNAFQRSGLNLEHAANSSEILRWLEAAMKFFLNVFYKLIPNYGVAIILVTILVKAVLFPSNEERLRLGREDARAPAENEGAPGQYKGNPQKLNQEMAVFYKKEGYNPMSGCLPLLIQFPIFIAMYNLFNNHFDLRGAMFIPGWISDLPAGSHLSFPMVNLVIWKIEALRALPIIYSSANSFTASTPR